MIHPLSSSSPSSSQTTPDVCDFFGQVDCKAEIEGAADVTLNVTSKTKLRHVFAHPCVLALEEVTPGYAYRVRFTPALTSIPLLSYQVCERMGEAVRSLTYARNAD